MVSYLSKPIKSDPYVLPLDLNLFTQVMSVKQNKFDVGVDTFQKQVDQMGALDVMRPQDREYLNSKISNIVNGVNSLGGVDFSDRNTLTQIENMGRDVYGDQKILNAVSSTSIVRNLVKTYNDYKTNPKLAKLYSISNEFVDMRHVNKYLSDKEVGSSYNGPSTATPFDDYQGPLTRALDKLKSSRFTELRDHGLYWDKQTNDYVTPEQVIDAAKGLLTEGQRAQMTRDGIYEYSGRQSFDPQMLVEKAADQYTRSLNSAQTMAQFYKGQADASANDPVAYKKYSLLAVEEQKKVDTLKESTKTFMDNVSKKLSTDPDNFMGELYQTQFFNGLASLHSFNRSDVSIIPNTAAMFKARFEQEAEFQKDKMVIEQRKLDLMERGLSIKEAEANARMAKVLNPKTGKYEYVNLSNFTSTQPDLNDPEGEKASEQTLQAESDEAKLAKYQLEQELLQSWLSKHPNLGTITSSANGSGIQFLLKNPEAQKALENANGQPGFQMDDLSAIGTGQEVTIGGPRSGFRQSKGTPLYNQMITLGYTPEELNLLNGLYRNYTMLKEGQPVAGVDEHLAESFKQIEMKEMLINANEWKLNDIREKVIKQANLTKEEADILAAGKSKDLSTGFWAMSGSIFDSPETSSLRTKYADVLNKVKERTGKSYDELVKDYWAGVSNHSQYKAAIVGKTKEEQQNFIYDRMQVLKIGDSSNYGPGNLDIIGLYWDNKAKKYMAKVVVKTGSADSQSFTTETVPIEKENAEAFGIYENKYADLDIAVARKGYGEVSVYGGPRLAVTAIIKKDNVNSLNDLSSTAAVKVYIKDDSGNKIWDPKLKDYKYSIIDVPQTRGMTPSQSYTFLETIVKNAAQSFEQARKLYPEQYKNLNQQQAFIEYLMNAVETSSAF